MKTIRTYLLVTLVLVLSIGIFSFTSNSLTPSPPTPLECGFKVTNSIKSQLLNMVNAFAGAVQSAMSTQKTFGVQFWVTSSNGNWSTACASIAQLDAALAKANQHYSSMKIKFKRCGTNTIGSKYHNYNFSSSGSAMENDMGKTHYKSTLINIYVVNNAGTSWANFPLVSSNDWILIKDDHLGNGSTLSHELGHYFGLTHTHETAMGTEATNGMNCAISGDMICDTPADPNLSDKMSGCKYTGSSKYKPDADNLMSYASPGCRKYFTAQQKARIVFFAKTARGGKKSC
jgi:hypothetical protein